MKNPIPFNPDTMTVSQLKECAEALSTVFDQMRRGVSETVIIGHLEQTREHMTKNWTR